MSDEPEDKHISVLNKFFGHTKFRPMQWKIIHGILEDRCDQCVVMATGYGKSLCYQYPAVYKGGLSIVVSPLISLMQDQVLSLSVLNIPACFLGTAQKARSQIEEGILNGDYRILYLTPEFCTGEYGQHFLKRIRSAATVHITVIAIDEAHCVSQWGLDFRKSYRNLGNLRKVFPDVPFLTVTATATEDVCKDICLCLSLRKPRVICTNFDRPNLYLSVSLKGDSIFGDIRRFLQRDGLKLRFPGSTIIYCPTKKMSETVANTLNENGVQCSVYHADLPKAERERVHTDFVKDIGQAIAATIAFGMGIDKPDVRLIIHYGAPREVESYYQEIGRAGRDGCPSNCHVFYSPADFNTNRYFLKNLTGKYLEFRNKMARNMERYLEAVVECRRTILLSYFQKRENKSMGHEQSESKTETPLRGDNHYCCDNCDNNRLNKKKGGGIGSDEVAAVSGLKDDAVLLLKAVKHFQGRYGMTVPILLLRGSNSKRLPIQRGPTQLFAAGKHKPETWWKAIGRLLLKEELVEEVAGNSFFGGYNRQQQRKFCVTTIAITQLGDDYIRDPKCVKLRPSKELIALVSSVLRPQATREEMAKNYALPISRERGICSLQTTSTTLGEGEYSSGGTSVAVSAEGDKDNKEEMDLQYDLYYELMSLRSEIAARLECMPYMIANNKTLMELARMRPSSREELIKVEGFGEVRADKIGSEIVARIREFELRWNLNRATASDLKSGEEGGKGQRLKEEEGKEEEDLWGKEDDSFLAQVQLPGSEKGEGEIVVEEKEGKTKPTDFNVADALQTTFAIPSDDDDDDDKVDLAVSLNAGFNCKRIKRWRRIEYEDSDYDEDEEKKKKKKEEGQGRIREKLAEKPIPGFLYKTKDRKMMMKRIKSDSLFS